MKTHVLFLAAAMAVTAVQASAAAVEDTDGNGAYSMDELMAAYPDMTEETFATADADGSGEVSEDELAAAVDMGILAE
ncbi:EF-hand domain-containing protein [Roseovarius amoyensis]|uniref:EF-hand domain-containing protein n=1 Tax=Roseovarius amoyensis TaxID=2211448 RepID=UPI000DBE6D93|nr:EF-hand domain-containing protein [Roseovarius amoyensis]